MFKKNLVYILSIFITLLSVSCSSDDNDVVEKMLDTEKPNIICPTNINVTIASTDNEVKVDYTTPNATDNIGATVTQINGLASGAMYPTGRTSNTFQAKDAAGNVATCSFDVIVTRDEPSSNKPFFIGSDPTPTGKKWTKIETMSDEFEGTTFDDNKWHRNPASDGFNWTGRPPALFKSDNVSVSSGSMNVTVEKLDAPKQVGNNTYTHGGAIVRSKETAKVGNYYECRMQANKTVMSSTFWIAFKQNCNSGPKRKLELDIQECVGRFSGDPVESPWAVEYANIYASNTWRHKRSCDVDVSVQSAAKTVLNEKNHSRFFVYGCFWKSPTEIEFYLDGVLSHKITNPASDFDLEGHITMAIETYDWNPIDSANILETGSVDERTTKYDWVRTWKLENK